MKTWSLGGKGAPKCSLPELEQKKKAKWVFFPHGKVIPQKFISQTTKMEISDLEKGGGGEKGKEPSRTSSWEIFVLAFLG